MTTPLFRKSSKPGIRQRSAPPVKKLQEHEYHFNPIPEPEPISLEELPWSFTGGPKKPPVPAESWDERYMRFCQENGIPMTEDKMIHHISCKELRRQQKEKEDREYVPEPLAPWKKDVW
jgi:hypothetical protein